MRKSLYLETQLWMTWLCYLIFVIFMFCTDIQLVVIVCEIIVFWINFSLLMLLILKFGNIYIKNAKCSNKNKDIFVSHFLIILWIVQILTWHRVITIQYAVEVEADDSEILLKDDVDLYEKIEYNICRIVYDWKYELVRVK